MTTTEALIANRAPDGTGQAPARLITRPLLVRFVSVVGTATSFYLLLSAVPLYARSAGASTGTAGLTTTALTLSSVATYSVTPRLMACSGSRLVLAAGLLALGLPALALAVSANIGLIMAACVVRGVGFAVLCVAGGALTVSVIPPRRRGEGLALVGIVGGIPSVATRWMSGARCHGYPGHRTTRRPVPAAEDWNELTSSAALKDRDSSRDLWSPHPPPLPATLFAVHWPGIPEASPRSHGMPCRGSAPGGAGARLALADSSKVSRRTDILREVERRFLAGLKAGVWSP